MSEKTGLLRPRRRGLVALGVLLCLFVVPVSISGWSPWASADGGSQNSQCIQREQVARGISPHHIPWGVFGSLRPNGGDCSTWLLGFEFRPQKGPYQPPWEHGATGAPMPGSFSWQWEVPSGGSLPSDFVLNARDEYEGSERTFAGAAGIHAKEITLALTNGHRLTIHPRLPSLGLRKRFVWLRNLRYFVQYYSRGAHVKLATVRNANGVIARIKGQQGSFGTGVLTAP